LKKNLLLRTDPIRKNSIEMTKERNPSGKNLSIEMIEGRSHSAKKISGKNLSVRKRTSMIRNLYHVRNQRANNYSPFFFLN